MRACLFLVHMVACICAWPGLCVLLCVCGCSFLCLCVFTSAYGCTRALREFCACFIWACVYLCIPMCVCVRVHAFACACVCLCECACECVRAPVLFMRVWVCVRAHMMDWSMIQRASGTANALCSSPSARRRVRPAQRIRARQRRRHELPVRHGHRAWSGRMPESGGRGGEAVRRRSPSHWSADRVLLAHSRRGKLLPQHWRRPKQRLRAARVRRCA